MPYRVSQLPHHISQSPTLLLAPESSVFLDWTCQMILCCRFPTRRVPLRSISSQLSCMIPFLQWVLPGSHMSGSYTLAGVIFAVSGTGMSPMEQPCAACIRTASSLILRILTLHRCLFQMSVVFCVSYRIYATPSCMMVLPHPLLYSLSDSLMNLLPIADMMSDTESTLNHLSNVRLSGILGRPHAFMSFFCVLW